jgi:deoxyribodipyrimidine photo-lyase
VTLSPTIVWFRQDLRLTDQAALSAAAATGPVVALYILDDETPGRWRLGGASRWWLHGSLTALAQAIAGHGGRLILRRGRSAEVLPQVARETGAWAVFCTGHAEPFWRQAEAEVEGLLARTGIRFRAFPGTSLFSPGAVVGRQGQRLKVFTPFWKRCLELDPPDRPTPAPHPIEFFGSIPGDTLNDWRLLPTNPDWAGGLRQTWSPGEEGALARLGGFLNGPVADYGRARNRPEPSVTSGLSPHLHFGELSPRQVWHAVSVQLAADPALNGSGWSFLRELGWREFCLHTLDESPWMPDEPLQKRFARFPWSQDRSGLRAWQRGRTGFPFVDAGMRQLWQTGWMHNRVRMVVASFLVKDLLLPWQDGEAWFWDTLIDADLANNAGGWQWVAGCGTDAAPYFRIFNPVGQGEKFDPEGSYVRRWVPEIARLSDRWIHRPWQAPPLELAAAGVRLGVTYPMPILDHHAARARALGAFAAIAETD